MSREEKTWPTMTRRERLNLVTEALKDEEREAVMAAVEKFLRGRATTDFYFVTNVVLREAWRHEHGNTAEWDRMARLSGNAVT